MMKAFFSIFILSILLLSFTSVSANEPLKIRTSGGITSEYTAVDGYFLGVEMGFPLSKVLELSTGFSFSSTIPSKRLSYSYSVSLDQTSTTYGGSLPTESYYEGSQLMSIDLMLYLKPFGWFQNPKLEKHQLLIGTGIGYKTYTKVHSSYYLMEGEATLENFGHASGGMIAPYYFKMIYAKRIDKRVDIGCVFGVNGYDGEAQANYGIILGLIF